MISEWSKIDPRMTIIIEVEVTTGRTKTIETVNLLFSSLVRQKTRLRWRILEIYLRDTMIPRS
jgi:hypothetical protein